MVEYRCFLNTDPPLLVDFWSRLAKVDGLVEFADYAIFERFVFSKQYFDRDGLIVAIENERIVGFAHAGFSPDESMAELDDSRGIITQLRLDPSVSDIGVSQQLLKMATDYCRARGALVVHAGSDFPHSPFYLGFYGGSRHPGVISADAQVIESFEAFGFRSHDEIIIMELQLDKLKSVMGRQQMTVRRNYLINASTDPLEQSWWESCTLGGTDRERFTAIDKRSKVVAGSVSYWDMQPMSSARLGKSRGLYNLFTNEDMRRGGIATYLVGESLKHLAKSEISIVEAQTRQSDAASRALFEKLGFEETSTGKLMSLSLE